MPHCPHPTTLDNVNAIILMIMSSDKSLNNHQDHRHTASQTTLEKIKVTTTATMLMILMMILMIAIIVVMMAMMKMAIKAFLSNL